MLLNRARKNLDSKQLNRYNFNFLFNDEVFSLRPSLNNKKFFKIECGDFVTKLVEIKLLVHID